VYIHFWIGGRRGPGRMVVEFTTTCWIPLRWGVLDSTLCDKVCQWLAIGRWFSPYTTVSSLDDTRSYNLIFFLNKKDNHFQLNHLIQKWVKESYGVSRHFQHYFNLASVQNLLKKHQLLEADVAAHEVCVFQLDFEIFRIIAIFIQISSGHFLIITTFYKVLQDNLTIGGQMFWDQCLAESLHFIQMKWRFLLKRKWKFSSYQQISCFYKKCLDVKVSQNSFCHHLSSVIGIFISFV
jgi:hypothetical protein